MTTPTDFNLTNPRPIHMVALDLDGTLVNDALAISSRVQAVINALVASTNIRVVIATGRMFSSSVHFAQTMGVHEPIIAYQGAIIRSQAAGTPTLFHQPVSIPISQALVTWFQRQPNCFLNVYQHDHIYTTPTNEFAREYARLSGIEPIYVDNLVDVVSQQPVSKFLGIFQGDIHPILADLDSDFGHDIHYCQSRSNFLEMIHRDVSKWTAVKHLADSWGIDAANILTMGDQENDLQMLANAGVGVAMGNAPAHVNSVAALPTASITDDGAALVLEHVLANGHIDFSALPPGVSMNVHQGADR